MSGGSLNYFYNELEDHIGDFKDKELDDLVEDLSKLFHDREWYLSGDTGEGTWNEARDNFKKKWFTDVGRQERITKYLDDVKTELLESFGIKHHYCRDCKYWTTPDENHTYGKCSEHSSCLRHPCDTCEDWEERGRKSEDTHTEVQYADHTCYTLSRDSNRCDVCGAPLPNEGDKQ